MYGSLETSSWKNKETYWIIQTNWNKHWTRAFFKILISPPHPLPPFFLPLQVFLEEKSLLHQWMLTHQISECGFVVCHQIIHNSSPAKTERLHTSQKSETYLQEALVLLTNTSSKISIVPLRLCSLIWNYKCLSLFLAKNTLKKILKLKKE